MKKYDRDATGMDPAEIMLACMVAITIVALIADAIVCIAYLLTYGG